MVCIRISECYGVITTTHGVLTSPDHPAEYDDNLMCRVVLKAPPDSLIHIRFISMDIENEDYCGFDYLKVRVNILDNENGDW